ncbi:hypothetical protein AB4653_02190, partial [Vibrio sp. 10N.222.48.A3]|uniref:hypothetical protein n=1 Tax=Vibrio sp. 10N.222.48.A3 TaxID=3229604 RepID=UPI00355448ED
SIDTYLNQLLNLSSLRLILANSNGNQTGKNVIHFKNLNSVGSFIQSDWLKVQALYNKSILKADQEMIDQALEEVANNLGVIL